MAKFCTINDHVTELKQQGNKKYISQAAKVSKCTSALIKRV
jgi:hypothetical protein